MPSTWIVVWNKWYLRLQRSVTAASVLRGLRLLMWQEKLILPIERDHKCMSWTSIISALFYSQISCSSWLQSISSGVPSIITSTQSFKVGYDVTKIIIANAKVHTGSNHHRSGLK